MQFYICLNERQCQIKLNFSLSIDVEYTENYDLCLIKKKYIFKTMSWCFHYLFKDFHYYCCTKQIAIYITTYFKNIYVQSTVDVSLFHYNRILKFHFFFIFWCYGRCFVKRIIKSYFEKQPLWFTEAAVQRCS